MVNALKFILNFILVCSIVVQRADGAISLRLSHGWHGRLEVKLSDESDDKWGTVCEDRFKDNNFACDVVCFQLFGDRNGRVLTEASVIYGTAMLPIRLDDIICTGVEQNLDECLHNFWDAHNCDHTQDVGCACPTASGPSKENNVETIPEARPQVVLGAATLTPHTGYAEATCDSTKMRVYEFDSANYPGIGRAEVYDSATDTWLGFCDDHWSDLNAKIFCSCLKSSNPQFSDFSTYRAFWSDQLQTLPAVDLLSQTIHCEEKDVGKVTNILDCTRRPITTMCSRTEAAGVACRPVPVPESFGVPNLMLKCDPQSLMVCFSNAGLRLDERYLGLNPPCNAHATRTRLNATTICITIDMEKCIPSLTTADSMYKRYCYDVSYTQANNEPNYFLVDQGFARRACCSVEKTGQVSSKFKSAIPANLEVQVTTPSSFSLTCFLDETFGGTPLPFPAPIQRGDSIYCKIQAQTWDTNLFLVVPQCNITNGKGSSFMFHKDKCPQAPTLQPVYYNFDGHRWGFKIILPTFQNSNEVFLICSVYICDINLDSKPYCDRTCQRTGNSGKTRKRRVAIGAERSEASQPSDFTELRLQKTSVLQQGPFVIKEGGIGPVIMNDGTIQIVDHGKGFQIPDTGPAFHKSAQRQSTSAKHNVGVSTYSVGIQSIQSSDNRSVVDTGTSPSADTTVNGSLSVINRRGDSMNENVTRLEVGASDVVETFFVVVNNTTLEELVGNGNVTLVKGGNENMVRQNSTSILAKMDPKEIAVKFMDTLRHSPSNNLRIRIEQNSGSDGNHRVMKSSTNMMNPTKMIPISIALIIKLAIPL